jgi:hypothetical protein
MPRWAAASAVAPAVGWCDGPASRYPHNQVVYIASYPTNDGQPGAGSGRRPPTAALSCTCGTPDEPGAQQPKDVWMLEMVTATRFDRRMTNGKTKPCLMACDCDDGAEVEVVVKLFGRL